LDVVQGIDVGDRLIDDGNLGGRLGIRGQDALNILLVFGDISFRGSKSFILAT